MGVDARRPRPPGDGGNLSPVAKPARVLEHVPHRERRAVVGELGQVLARLIIERQLALLREQQYRRGGELLRDRPGFEDRVGCIRHIVFEIRHPVCLLQHRLAAAGDAHGAAGRFPRPAREHGVYLRFINVWGLGGAACERQ